VKQAKKEAEKSNLGPKLLITFKSPDGRDNKTVTFTKRPLGVSCSMDSMPIVVGEKPVGEAAEAGIAEGWILCQ
ncbi:fadB, partial [Symbiodinium necroappetens]